MQNSVIPTNVIVLCLLVTLISGNFFQEVRAAPPSEIPGVLSLNRRTAPPVVTTANNEIYAITGEPNGLYRSTDGKAWVQVTQNLPNTYFSAITIDAKGTMYAASPDGLLHSTDNGRTWSALPTVEQIFFLLSLADNTLLARTWKNGLLRSGDSGVTWYPVAAELHDHPVLSLIQDHAGGVWAATFGGGVYRSLDNGITWSLNGLESSYVMSLAIYGDGTLYAGTYQDCIYRYSSSGWVRSDRGLPTQITVQLLTATPTGLIASTAHHGLYLSRTGTSWTPIADKPDRIDEITGILPTTDGQWLVATRPQGLFRINPLTQLWMPVPVHVNVRTVVADRCGGAYAVLATGQILHSRPATPTPTKQCGVDGRWEDFGSMPAESEILFINNAGAVFAGGKQGLALHNSTTGDWQKINLPNPMSQVTCVTEMATNLIIGTNGQGLLRSTDGGATWIPLPEGGTIKTCVATDKRIYAATDLGLSVSEDNGITWNRYRLASKPLPLVIDGERGVIFALLKAKLTLMESIEGSAPTTLYLDGSAGRIAVIRKLAVADNFLYVASTKGIDLFTRNGTFWNWNGQLLPRLTITDIAPLPDGWVIVAAHHGLFVLHGLDEALQIPIAP